MESFPFNILIRPLRKTQKPLAVNCTALLRHVPTRRSIYAGTSDGREVIVKVFLRPMRGWYHLLREKRGLEKLASRGLAAPRLLLAGRDSSGKPALVIEKIADTVDLRSFFALKPAQDELQTVKHRWLSLLADMHEKGVMQRDLHTGNFLWDGSQVYALDPAQMRFFPRPLSRSLSMRQAATILAGFGPVNGRGGWDLLSDYYRMRQWNLDSAAQKQCEQLAIKIKNRAIEKGLAKILRTCRRFISVKSPGYRGIFDRAAFDGIDLPAFMKNLDTMMEAGRILKRGNTCFVSRAQLNDKTIAVKRYNHLGLRHSLRHTLKKSRARKCWMFGHRLIASGIPCAAPVAFIEQVRFGIVWQSYILNEYVEGQNIGEYLNLTDLPQDKKDQAVERIYGVVSQLAQNGILHNDLKPPNLLISEEKPVLIDLDSMKLYRWRWIMSFCKRKMESRIRDRISYEKTCV